MPFNPIDSNKILTSEPVTSDLLTQVKDNLDNHEDRIAAIEGGGSAVSYPPIVLRLNGPYGYYVAPIYGVLKTTMNFTLQIVGVKLIVDRAGFSGTTSIDLKFKRGTNPYTSIFTGTDYPSLAYTAGDDATSTNGTLDVTKTTLLAGDILRLDIPQVQMDGSSLMVRIDYVKV